MKVLVVDEEIPFPLNSGKKIRTYNLLRYLAEKHEIYYICRKHEGHDDLIQPGIRDNRIKFIIVDHPIRKKTGFLFYAALFANLFSRYPYSVQSHYSKKLTCEILKIVDEKNIDLIHCEWSPYAINLQEVIKQKPSIIVAHNVESMIWRRNFEIEKNLLKKAYIFLQWKKMEYFEKNIFKKFNRAVAVSTPDKNIISNWTPSNRIDIISNGVDSNYFVPSKNSVDHFSLVFSGSMDWRPNVDGMIYFLNEIWPHLKKKYPECTLTIVGRNPLDSLKIKVKNENSVILTGTVDDVRPFIDRAMIYIVPLRVGGGSRLKILEALSMQKPVVSTTIGAEGLELTDNKEILISDTPEDFIRSIDKLFHNAELRNTLGGAGRKLVNTKYVWKNLSDDLEKCWITAISSHKH